jgi:hypothetical protein
VFCLWPGHDRPHVICSKQHHSNRGRGAFGLSGPSAASDSGADSQRHLKNWRHGGLEGAVFFHFGNAESRTKAFCAVSPAVQLPPELINSWQILSHRLRYLSRIAHAVGLLGCRDGDDPVFQPDYPALRHTSDGLSTLHLDWRIFGKHVSSPYLTKPSVRSASRNQQAVLQPPQSTRANLSPQEQSKDTSARARKKIAQEKAHPRTSQERAFKH